METLRLAALRRDRTHDTESERRFDDLACLARMSAVRRWRHRLVDDHRNGSSRASALGRRRLSRAVSCCAHAIEQRELFIVPDTLQDERFRDEPAGHGRPAQSFLCGSPARHTRRSALGTLCVIDQPIAPPLTRPAQRAPLDALAGRGIATSCGALLIDAEWALAARDRAEAEQATTMGELRAAHENVRRLSALTAILLDVPVHNDDSGRSSRDSGSCPLAWSRAGGDDPKILATRRF